DSLACHQRVAEGGPTFRSFTHDPDVPIPELESAARAQMRGHSNGALAIENQHRVLVRREIRRRKLQPDVARARNVASQPLTPKVGVEQDHLPIAEPLADL